MMVVMGEDWEVATRDGTPASGPPGKAGTSTEGAALYVHVPFCVQKCTYCDFYSRPATPAEIAQVVEDLLDEARRRAPWRPRTVFLGGGTPSILSAPQLRRLFDGLHGITSYRDSAVEVSVECNPESLDPDKVATLRDLGVNRLTVGVQSLRSDLLRLFGRVHSAPEGLAAVRTAQEGGIESVGVDMIYAVPGQRLTHWEADLARILALGVQHISAYCLAFEEETVMTRWLETGALLPLPEADELAFFHRTREILSAHGYTPYEVSNHSLSGHQCAHNLNYWRSGPCVGLGPSAASKIGHRRLGNHRSYRAWKAALAQGESGLAWSETLTPLRRLGEAWWLGLRLTEGVDAVEARTVAGFGPHAGGEGTSAADPALALAATLAEEGWLEREGGRFRLSERGLPLGDNIAARFLSLPLPPSAGPEAAAPKDSVPAVRGG